MMSMSSTSGGDEEFELWTGLLFAVQRDGDSNPRPLRETRVNEESVPRHSMPENTMEIPQRLPEIAPPVKSSVLDRNPLAVSDGVQLAGVPFQTASGSQWSDISLHLPQHIQAQPYDDMDWAMLTEQQRECFIGLNRLNQKLHELEITRNSNGFLPRAKRPRAPDWSAEEKIAYLELKEAALWIKGKDWNLISQGLLDRHGFRRSAKCCEDLWGTLRKDFRAIQRHEFSKSALPRARLTSGWVSYWEMDQGGRSKNKLPRVFPLEAFNTMKRTLDTQEQLKGVQRKTRRIHARKSIGHEDKHSHLHLADPSGGGFGHHSTQGEGSGVIDGGETPNLKCAGRKRCGKTTDDGEEQINLLAPLVKHQVEDAVNSALHPLRPACGESRSGAAYDDDDRIATLSSQLKQLVEDSVTSAIRSISCKDSTGATIDEDELLTKLAPFFKKLIADEVSSALEPISSALLLLEHQDQEYLEEINALAEKKRAIALEEMQLRKRQRSGRYQRTPREREGREKKTSSMAIIAALEGLNV